MDVDDLITYFFLFLFFVLPSILKRKGKGKKTAKKAEQKLEAKAKAVKKKKSNLFDRLGEAIREAVRELENQAKEAKRSCRPGIGFRVVGTRGVISRTSVEEALKNAQPCSVSCDSAYSDVCSARRNRTGGARYEGKGRNSKS